MELELLDIYRSLTPTPTDKMSTTNTTFTVEELADHFDYLDELRDSGETNMWGAGAYLQREQGLDRKEASSVLGMWMETFSDEEPSVRAAKAIAKATTP